MIIKKILSGVVTYDFSIPLLFNTLARISKSFVVLSNNPGLTSESFTGFNFKVLF
jgi:hypothetical protein